jgi:hypothetical protein
VKNARLVANPGCYPTAAQVNWDIRSAKLKAPSIIVSVGWILVGSAQGAARPILAPTLYYHRLSECCLFSVSYRNVVCFLVSHRYGAVCVFVLCGMQLPLIPLLEAELIQHQDIIIDAKSGTTGAGRAAKQVSLYSHAN